MAWDDPVVWILIVALAVFLFGSNKIPELARTLGRARKEFESGLRGLPPGITQNLVSQNDPSESAKPTNASAPTTPPPLANDPLIQAANAEGLDTQGKTRDQIAFELALKLKKK